MLKVKYKGPKSWVPVFLPVGVKKKTSIKQMLKAAPFVELEDSEAKKLVALDPHNFELAVDEGVLVEPKAEEAGEPGMPKRRGRKPKAEEAGLESVSE